MLTQIFMTKYFRRLMNKKNRKLKPKNLIQLFLGVIPFLILTITFSCEEDPSALGSNLLPESDKIKIHYDSLLKFNCYVLDNQSIHTTNLTHYTLGTYEDDYFGLVKGEYAGQFLPLIFNENVDDVIIDSAVLYLHIDSIYGIPHNNIKFNVYELNTEILEDSIYYSDYDINSLYSTEDIINTNSIISGDSLIILPLANTFAEKLISNGDSIYDSSDIFKSFFKGISIIPELLSSSGGLITTNITSINTKIILYYQTLEEDSLAASYSLAGGYRFTKYTIDYSTAMANYFINDPTSINDSLLFIQGLNGIKSKITFANYKEWIDEDSTYSILNAELIFPVHDVGQFDLFAPPEQLYFYYSDSDSSLYQIEDYVSGNIFGGIYDQTKKQYSFNISKHFKDFINGDMEDSCLNFSITNRAYYPNRVILKSGNNIKFNVTYTKH